MATNKIEMMMLVNLKAYTTPQLLSTTHHSPLPMFINKLRYCPSNKRQIITCSSSKVPRFGIANAASKEIMLLSTAQQPYTTTPFGSTADHQSFEPSCDHLLVVKENIIEHAVQMFDTALLEYLQKLEEKLSKANVFSPLLCTMKQLFTNMDKVFVLSELLLLAEKPSITLNLRKMQIWEEFPETPKEIFKAFRELIFADNNLRSSLTDASTSKLIEDPNALTMFQLWNPLIRLGKYVIHCQQKKSQKHPSSVVPDHGKGQAECTYTFYYGSNNQEWIDEFVKKAKIVINDPCIKDMKDVDIELCRIGELIKRKSKEAQDLSDLIKRSGKKVPHDLRHYFVSGSDGRFVLTSMIRNHEKLLLDDSGRTILKVLEEFEQWKNNIVQNKDFEESFIDYYQKISSLIAGGEDIKSI